MKTIGEKIKDLRRNKNVTQEELSFELNVSRQTIHKWENDLMQPNAESIKLLCSYFKVQADYFFNEDSVVNEAQQESAISDEKNVHIDKVKILLIILSIFLFAIFLFVLLITICSGLSVYSNNIGFVEIASISIDMATFIAFLISSILLLALIVLLVIFLIKRGK